MTINELNESYTLSKSVKAIIRKMMDELPPQDDDNASAFYGLINIMEQIVDKQNTAIKKLLKNP